MSRLHLSPELSMPLDAITETFGILAARGAGKSNTAAVMAEEMFEHGLPFCVVDPVGSWWGLRSNDAGNGPGLPLAIFGGPKGDVPLERKGGNLIADIVVDERISCVLDLRGFDSEASKKEFLLDFARRLYARNEAPLHLFLEEADDYIPQKPLGQVEPLLLRAWENIVRRGRSRGLGMTMITQRSASLNKNVLTQAQTLIAMRTTGPQDRKAIEEWVKYNDQSRDILEALPGLADGEAWVWSPQFLKITKRVQFRRRRTFDSGSTPKMAAKGKTATLADIDVSTLRVRMADTIKRAEEDDPKILKRKLHEALRAAKTPVTAAAAPSYPDQRAEVAELRQAIAGRDKMIAELDGRLRKVAALAGAETQPLAALPPASAPVPRLAPRPAPPKPRTNGHAEPSGEIGGAARKILAALAQHGPCNAARLTLLSGYAYTGSFRTYLSALRSAGLIQGGNGEIMSITDAGLAHGPFDELPTGEALRRHWLNFFGASESKILQALLANPGGLDAQQLCSLTDYEYTGSFRTYLSKLRTAGVLVGKNTGVMRASDELLGGV